MKNIEIIPAINTDNFEEIKEKIRLVEPFSKWVHLDVADGTFTKNTIWSDASDLVGFQTSLNIEAHLMIGDIEHRVSEWFIPEVKRIIFHLESAINPAFVIKKCREAKKEVGIAISPDTPWTQLKPYFTRLSFVNFIQVLSVYPGLMGQEFIEENLDKIKHLRENCQSCIIEVDGGMKVGIVKNVVEAGADIIVAASAIFGKPDVGRAIEELRRDTI